MYSTRILSRMVSGNEHEMSGSDRASRVHRQAIVIDGHSDILLPVVGGVTRLDVAFTDLELQRWRTIAANRTPPALGDVPYELEPLAQLVAPAGQYELPLLEQGGVTAQCVSIFLRDDQLDHALETALEMVAALHRAVESNPDRCLLATSVADIRRAKQESKVAYVLTMEGAEPIGRRIDLIDVFWRLGLRMTTLTHSRRNQLADGTQLGVNTGGLTSLGRLAVRRCEELGIVLDTAHLSDRGFWDLIECANAPVVCSHTSVLTPSPGYRAPWDEVNLTYGMSKAEAIARTGGLIGVVFWSMADSDALVREFDRIVELIGAEHAGLGTDFFGFRDAPQDVQHIGQLGVLTEKLVARGYDDAAIQGMLGGNYLRVFEQVWR
jgi:membrane dipeptidase